MPRAASPGDGEEDAILAASGADGADAVIEFADEGAVFSRSDAAGSSLALIIALFVVFTIGLLLCIAGGVRAFRDRERYGFP